MALALLLDQAIFDNTSLVRIGARFVDNYQECMRCKMVPRLWDAFYADGLSNFKLSV